MPKPSASGSPRSWLDESELRVGLGCMRLTNEAPIIAAAEAGITVFDTARAYGGSEQLVGRALRGWALGAGRHQGRHGRRLGARRAREDDPC